MWTVKDVYYVSDSTALLTEDIGKSLLCQFPAIGLNEEKIPFVRTPHDAEKAVAHILKQSGGLLPLVFCTIINSEVLAVFDKAEIELFDLYGGLLDKLEVKLEAQALRQPGVFRNRDDAKPDKRVEAIHYTIEHDDGQRTSGYDQAEIILVGVSRTGKTPVSVYLATHMGLKTANFPMTADHLEAYELPADIIRNRKRTVGLTISPQFLHRIREERYKGSSYAQLATCRAEIGQAEQLYMRHGINTLNTEGKSIEELAVQITQLLGISKKKR
ncbi:MAG: pyruvate, phosphate dikinase/phosphoenolpyruvate synthase regulator [Candidatus Electrothrix aestuarii]|uniref:Pyruvate, phosphate dikinase/phosphoenolpyruvate synthase regulator n=1 Tax=Candidatus Electrothrix aestuarii TaxID=3062594 RepID=A0AAU8LR66_9BACT|nr:pyruvate, phosphate dikinase/phosphoenolpyruvate synthase regulator [Candidatus Electrothrix aestuarii]